MTKDEALDKIYELPRFDKEEYVQHLEDMDAKDFDKQLEVLRRADGMRETSFECAVYMLIFQADPDNMYKLFKGFPDQVVVAICWRSGLLTDTGFQYAMGEELTEALKPD